MEDGVVLDRLAGAVARDGDLHLEVAARDHPGEQLKRLFRVAVGRDQRHVAQVLLDLLAQRLSFFDGLDFALIERTADDEPHAAVVAHQSFDAPCGEGEGACVEITGQPVVALGVLQGPGRRTA